VYTLPPPDLNADASGLSLTDFTRNSHSHACWAASYTIHYSKQPCCSS